MRRLKDWLLVLTGVCVTIAVCSALLAENSLHIWQRPEPSATLATGIAQSAGGLWESVQVTATDRVPLRGWVFSPHSPNGSAAILLHGVGDTRRGVADQARFLLQHGYIVLTPDSSGHGVSGGTLISYGIEGVARRAYLGGLATQTHGHRETLWFGRVNGSCHLARILAG